jgi:hypothetical protein
MWRCGEVEGGYPWVLSAGHALLPVSGVKRGDYDVMTVCIYITLNIWST